MKYRHLVSSTTPASLQTWLEEELESRGIDGVYTRYILSLLQHDPLVDPLKPIDCEHGQNKRGRDVASLFLSHSKSRHRRWKSWDHDYPRLLVGHLKGSKGESIGGCDHHCGCSSPLCSNMECKKTVAVECLKSASEEKNGIEKLIDEVCTKLKNYTVDSESPKCLSLTQDTGVLIRSLTLSEPFSSGKQMEMYYSAFPALGSKGISLMDADETVEFLHESSPAELINCKVGAWAQQLAEEKKDEQQEPYCLHEKREEISGWDIYGPIERTDKNGDVNRAVLGEIGEPTFIVPKMLASHRVPSVNMFAPFTSATCQRNISKVLGSDEKIDQDNENSLELDFNEQGDDGVALEEDGWDKMSSLPVSGITSPSNCFQSKELMYLETDLASKFNSALAAIWGVEETGDPGLELSFKIYSMPLGISKADIMIVKTEDSPAEQDEEAAKNINFFIGSAEDMSVWSTKREDVKVLSCAEATRIDVVGPTSPAMSDLLHNLVSHGVEKDGAGFSACWSDELDNSSETENALVLSNGNQTLVEDLLRDDYYQSEPSEEKPSGAFCLSPEMFFKETENDCMLSSTDDTEFEFDSLAELPPLPSSVSKKPGGPVYNLWNSPTPPPIPTQQLPLLGIRGDSVWPASDPAEKVAEWIIKQFEEGPSSSPWVDALCGSSSPSPWDNGSLIFVKDSTSDHPISRENCTLTYHKGESRFVEVVPTVHLVENKSERTASRNSIISPNSFGSPAVDYAAVAPAPITTLSDDEEVENLLTSHKTHFTPIRQESSETESSICDYEAVAVALEQSTTTYLKSKVKDGEPMNYEPKLASSTTLEEMLLLSAPLSLEDLERSKSPMESTEVLQGMQLGWKLGLYRDKSTSTEPTPGSAVDSHSGNLETILEPSESTYNEEDPMGFSSFRKMRIWSNNSMENLELELASEIPLPPHQMPWKWSTTDDADENEDPELLWQLKKTPDVTQDKQIAPFPGTSRPATPSKPKAKECNLEALRRELEAEEEELFRDINLVSDSEEYCCAPKKVETSEPLVADTKKREFKEFAPKDFFLFRDDKLTSEESELTLEHSISDLDVAESSTPEENDSALPAIPTDKILYSSQLEEEWHKSSQPFDIQVPRKVKSKSRSSPQRRPCSFYLEGNCRRSDCKFSHDLSSITCRFWEEGSCFKGVTCPFLHGYLSDEALRQKYGSKIKFALESEADFPSLSNSSSQGTPLTVPKDVKVTRKEAYAGRILRPKKKKLSSVSKASYENSNSSADKNNASTD